MTIAAISPIGSSIGSSFRAAADSSTGSAITATNTAGGAATDTAGSTGSTGSTGSGSTQGSAAAGAASTLDREAFLKLLVAQLKYQDPSKPVDASEMISQSAQLSVVDKLDQISTALVESGTTNRLALGASIIGKSVTFVGPDEIRVTQTVTAVRFVGADMVLRAGTWDVPLGSVVSFEAAPIAAPTAGPTAGSTIGAAA